LKQCKKCTTLTRNSSGYCDEHELGKYDNRKQYDHNRDKQSVKFYNSSAWIKARSMALARDHGLCQCCLRVGVVTTADVVHHVKEIKQDYSKRLVLDNLMSLCNICHNKIHKGN
jgi:5-methylcytosine-specific restriction protein A